MKTLCRLALACSAISIVSPLQAASDPPLVNEPEVRELAAQTDNFSFKYSYPKSLTRQPGLEHYLDRKAREELEKFTEEADRDHADMASENSSSLKLLPYEYEINWQENGETPDFLSLSQLWYGFYGGAHGMIGSKSLLWDKYNNKAIGPLALFTSAEEFDTALEAKFCSELNAQRSEKRGRPIAMDSDDSFEKCVAPSAQTVILGSTNGKRFNTINIYIGPYAAGPYVEGDYQIDLPVTEAILDSVKPAYRKNFAVKR